MNLKAITENRAVKMGTDTIKNWLADNALRLSAALAYYSVFSIAPLLVIAISIAGLVLGPDAVRGQLDDQLKGYVGAQAASALQSMVQSASKPSQGWIGAVTGFVTLLLGASGVFGQLKDALNTIWEVKTKSGGGVMGFIRDRLLNFGMVLVIGFLLLISLMLTTVIAALNKYLDQVLHLPPVLWGAISFLVSFGLVTTLFALIFKVLPDAEIKWRNVWVGATVTSALFEVGKFGLAFYLGRESTSSSYGAAGAIVLLLLWVYYTSCILFLGAEFTRVYAGTTGHDIQPAGNAESVSPAARTRQGMSPEKDPPASAAEPAFRTSAETPGRKTAGHSHEIRIQPVKALLLAVGFGAVVGLITRKKN